jgi:hypothetical protein
MYQSQYILILQRELSERCCRRCGKNLDAILNAKFKAVNSRKLSILAPLRGGIAALTRWRISGELSVGWILLANSVSAA